jgi:ATP-binding cassette subfamily F protein 3
MNYSGTLCLVSHDRDFVAPLADQLLEIQDQRVTPLVLNYEEFLAKKVQETRERLRRTLKPNDAKPSLGAVTHTLGGNGADAGVAGAMGAGAGTGAAKISNNQRRSWENELKKIEKDIASLESRQNEISDLLATGDFAGDPAGLRHLIDEQTKNQQSLDQKFSRWEELSLLL